MINLTDSLLQANALGQQNLKNKHFEVLESPMSTYDIFQTLNQKDPIISSNERYIYFYYNNQLIESQRIIDPLTTPVEAPIVDQETTWVWNGQDVIFPFFIDESMPKVLIFSNNGLILYASMSNNSLFTETGQKMIFDNNSYIFVNDLNKQYCNLKNSRLQIPLKYTFTPADSFTINFSIKADSNNNTLFGNNLCCAKKGNNTLIFMVYESQNNHAHDAPCFYLLNNNNQNRWLGSGNIKNAVTSWQYYTIVYNKGYVSVYINGHLDGQDTKCILNDSFSTIYFRNDPWEYWGEKPMSINQCIADISIYNKAFSQQEVINQYQKIWEV